MKQIETRICPYSGKEFIPKRNNQRFESKENRIAFHNEFHNALRRKLSYIDKPLLKNYKILESLLKNKNELKVNGHYLRGAGFDFMFLNNLTQIDNVFAYRVYDIAFMKLDNEEYLIRRGK